jgi:O-antigen/teichoic acid export membrane protein
MIFKMGESPLKKFLRNNLVVFILLNSGGALNYLFQIVLGRTLSPDQYGSFNSLLSTSALITAPITIVHLVFSRFIARLDNHGQQQIKTLLIKSIKPLLGMISSIIIIGVFAIPSFKSFLHLETSLPIILMLFAACFSTLQQVLAAVCEGMHKFFALGIVSGGCAFMRFIFGVLFLVVFNWGIEGGLIAVAFAAITTIIYGMWELRDVLNSQAKGLPSGFLPEMIRYSIPSFLMITMVVVMCNIDIVLVRHYCSPDQAGYYATAAILGRIAFFLPSSLLLVLFPSVAKATASGDKDEHYFWISLGLTTILTGSVFLVLFFSGEPIIQFVYGNQYNLAAPILKVVTAAMGLLALSHVIFSYSLARSEFSFLWPLVGGTIIMISLVYFYHETAETIAWILLLSMGIIFAGTVLNRVYIFFFKPVISS